MATYNGSLVEWTIATIAENWDPGNYDPQPELINRDDSELHSSGKRDTTHDLAEANAVGVGYTDADKQVSGWEYDFDLDDVISIRVEAVHEDEWGHVAGDDDFRRLREEVQRCLYVERQWPIPPADGRDDWYRTLVFRSATPRNAEWADYYRYDFDVGFLGREDLPGTP